MTAAPCEVTSDFYCSYGNSHGHSTFLAAIDISIEDVEGTNNYY
jgi:hypothetical protein